MNNKENNQFKDVLNNYINILNCTANELSKKSDISSSVISRYRSGDKIPKYDSLQIKKLINGIFLVAKDKKIKNISIKELTTKFNNILNYNNINYNLLKDNLNVLIVKLNINISEISHYLGYDPSYISKIRSGKRKPAYLDLFADGIINYIIKNIDKQLILNILSINNDDLIDTNKLKFYLKEWICTKNNNDNNYINDFFSKINGFNLNDYIKIIHFDTMKIPSTPFQIPKSKNYYGLKEMKQAELDFFKGTILSKNSKEVFMCSDMQMDDMAKDIDFSKKWMYCIALMIKKGLTLNVIHNFNRPFNEMMLGIESWLPIYMTGQVNPYYIDNNNNKIYSHLNYISNNYCLYGECITGYHKDGKYYLTNNSKELDYYKKKVECLLKKAKPAMEIYTLSNKDKYNSFFNKDILYKKDRKRILSSLPFHTLTEEILLDIIKINKIENSDIIMLKKLLIEEQSYINTITKNSILTDEITFLTELEFNKNKPILEINSYFYEYKLKYNYQLYMKHYKNTIEYKNNNYKCNINQNQTFNNIDIYINTNNYAIISKKDNPNIRFVIKQDKLLNAIENFIPPIIEK